MQKPSKIHKWVTLYYIKTPSRIGKPWCWSLLWQYRSNRFLGFLHLDFLPRRNLLLQYTCHWLKYIWRCILANKSEMFYILIDEYILNMFNTILGHFTAHSRHFVMRNAMLISVLFIIAKIFESSWRYQHSIFTHSSKWVITFRISRSITNMAF